MSKLKSKCCERFKHKPKACKSCPLMIGLSKKQQKKQIRKLRLRR